jgi:hypothetical protein
MRKQSRDIWWLLGTMVLVATAALLAGMFLTGCAGLDVKQGLGQRDTFSRKGVTGDIDMSMDGTQKQETLIAELDGGEVIIGPDGRPTMSTLKVKKIFWRKSEPTDVAADALARAVEAYSAFGMKALDLAARGLPYVASPPSSVPPPTPTTGPAASLSPEVLQFLQTLYRAYTERAPPEPQPQRQPLPPIKIPPWQPDRSKNPQP